MGPFGVIAAGLWLAVATPKGSDASQAIDKRIFGTARGLLLQGNSVGAEAIYQNCYDKASASGDKLLASRCLHGVGACRMSRFQYRQALQSVLEARRLAMEAGNADEIAGTSSSLASLYLQTNDTKAAEDTAQRALALSPNAPNYYKVPLLYILASIANRSNRVEQALAYYRQGIQLADAAGYDEHWILGLSHVSYVLLSAGRLDEAERPMLEVFRYRWLKKDPAIAYSFALLAELELRRGNLSQSRTLIERAIASSPRKGLASREFLLIQARILEACHDYDKAHVAYVSALETSRRWRVELLPADSFRIAGESSLANLYDAALENAARLYFDHGRKDILTSAWLETEEWRTSSLRTFLGNRPEWLARAGPEYWETLAEFRRVDASAAGTSPVAPTVLQNLERLRVKLAEMESFAGIAGVSTSQGEIFPPVNALTPYGRSLKSSEVFISFQLGERVSHRWVLSSQGLDWTLLPGRSRIRSQVEEFRQAIERGQAAGAGRPLGDLLLGGLQPVAERAEHWTIALDDSLHQLPLGALSRTGKGYVIEQHTVLIVPGAWSLLEKDRLSQAAGGFIGVADAVYNSADPRWIAAARDRKGIRAARNTDSGLPRLIASSEEIATAARAWSAHASGVQLLTGVRATRQDLVQALKSRPAVVHFAAHVVPNSDFPDRAYIALSLTGDGSLESLTTTDVAHLSTGGALVVMDGCHSMQGRVVAGSGLIGLVRAWLMSGAGAVVASLWPTPDDPGAIFESFYRELRNETGLPGQSRVHAAAVALRRAQLEMLRTHSWRAEPKYWATFMITGRNN